MTTCGNAVRRAGAGEERGQGEGFKKASISCCWRKLRGSRMFRLHARRDDKITSFPLGGDIQVETTGKIAHIDCLNTVRRVSLGNRQRNFIRVF